MPPHDHHHHAPQTPGQRASLGGDVASQALNEALAMSFRLLKIAMALVAGLFLVSGVFIVKENQEALVLRFGRLVVDRDGEAVIGPGIHFAWPFLIDEVLRFPVERRLPLTVTDFWIREEDREKGRTPTTLEPGRSGYTLTGDANILHSAWSLDFRIADPVKLLRHVADPRELADYDPKKPTGTIADLLRSLLRSAVIQSMATFGVDDIVGGGKRELLQSAVRDAFNLMLGRADVGIEVTKLTLDTIGVPLQTKEAFDQVTSAIQERDTLVRQAQAAAERITTEARGAANRIQREAEFYKTEVVATAEADAKYITALLKQFPNDPKALDRFLEYRLAEVLESVQREADEIFIVAADAGAGRKEVRILVNRDPAAVRSVIRGERRRREKAAQDRIPGLPPEGQP